MKYKMIAVVLALTVMSWAQTATQTAPSAPQQSTAPTEKAKCPCCDKMATADAKDAHACCAHHDMKGGDGKEMASCCSGKEAASCCGGKDAKSCMRSDKDKTAAACCGGNCGKECGEACCSGKKTEKASKTCCGDELRS